MYNGKLNKNYYHQERILQVLPLSLTNFDILYLLVTSELILGSLIKVSLNGIIFPMLQKLF